MGSVAHSLDADASLLPCTLLCVQMPKNARRSYKSKESESPVRDVAAEIADGLGLEPDELAAVVSSVASSSGAVLSPASSSGASSSSEFASRNEIDELKQLMKMMFMQGKVSDNTASSNSRPGTPECPGTPNRDAEIAAAVAEKEREMKLKYDADQKEIKRKFEEDLRAYKKETVAHTYCGCSSGGCIMGKAPCKCIGNGKGCSARCGCGGEGAGRCNNDHTGGVVEKKQKIREVLNTPVKTVDSMSDEELEALIMRRKAAAKYVQYCFSTRRHAISSLFIYSFIHCLCFCWCFFLLGRLEQFRQQYQPEQKDTSGTHDFNKLMAFLSSTPKTTLFSSLSSRAAHKIHTKVRATPVPNLRILLKNQHAGLKTTAANFSRLRENRRHSPQQDDSDDEYKPFEGTVAEFIELCLSV